MFAIAFDLTVRDTTKHHPKGMSAAYRDVGNLLAEFDFEWVQGSLYVTRREDLTNLFAALAALKALRWFPPSVRDIRAFRMENWSDFTDFVKSK
jgi:virulence-associated protein VapD